MKTTTIKSKRTLYSLIKEIIEKRTEAAEFPVAVVKFAREILDVAVNGFEITELDCAWKPRTTLLGDLLLATAVSAERISYSRGLVKLAAQLYHDACFDWVYIDEAIELAVFTGKFESGCLGDLFEKSETKSHFVSTPKFEREYGFKVRVPQASRLSLMNRRGEEKLTPEQLIERIEKAFARQHEEWF